MGQLPNLVGGGYGRCTFFDPWYQAEPKIQGRSVHVSNGCNYKVGFLNSSRYSGRTGVDLGGNEVADIPILEQKWLTSINLAQQHAWRH